MSIALGQIVLELTRRVEALERTVTASPRRYGVLYARARAMKAQGDALKAEIAALMKAHPGAKAFTIWSHLTREPRPKLRRVQQAIAEIKRSVAVTAHKAPAQVETRDV